MVRIATINIELRSHGRLDEKCIDAALQLAWSAAKAEFPDSLCVFS
jgi:hypothetical protein